MTDQEPKRVEGLTLICIVPPGATWSLVEGLGLIIAPVDARPYHVGLDGHARDIADPGHA